MTLKEFTSINKLHIETHLKLGSIRLYKICIDQRLIPEFSEFEFQQIKRINVINIQCRAHIGKPHNRDRFLSRQEYKEVLEIVDKMENNQAIPK